MSADDENLDRWYASIDKVYAQHPKARLALRRLLTQSNLIDSASARAVKLLEWTLDEPPQAFWSGLLTEFARGAVSDLTRLIAEIKATANLLADLESEWREFVPKEGADAAASTTGPCATTPTEKVAAARPRDR